MSYSRRELYALGEPLGESVTTRKNGHTIYGGGDGGGSAPSSQTVTQTNVPDYLRPEMEALYGRAKAITEQPYQVYSGQRIAGFDPLQQMAYQGASQMQMPERAGQSMENMYGFAQRAGNMQYNPSQYGNQFQAPRQYRPGQFGYDQVQNQQIEAAQLGMAPRARAAQARAAQLGMAPETQAAYMQAAQLGEAPTYQGQQLNYTPQNIGFERVGFERVNAPQLRDLQMQAAGDVGTQSFTQPGAQQQFMDPYMQNVVDVQTREAQRMADRAGVQRRGARAQQGAYGGSAAALENAEANRNLATQLGDIQAKGSQAAYQSGMGQFNTEQQAALQAALANQQVQQQTGVQNLSAALQTQGLGAQTGLTAQQLNQAAGLQSALANQAAGIDVSKFNQTQQYNAALQNAQLAQQQQLANQSLQGQYGLNQGQFSQAANAANQQAANQIALANQALQGQYGLQQGQFDQQIGLANQQAQNQIGLANQALQGQYGLQQGQFNQQAAMQNPQLNMQAQQLNQQARADAQRQAEASRQFGYGQQMQAAGMGAQYGQAANQLNEQSRQYGAGLGLQGLQAGMQGMTQYGNLGNLYNQQQQGIYNFQNQMGGQQQRLQQDILSQQYQDFLNQQRYDREQLGFMSDLIRGAGMNSSQTTYQAPPPLSSQIPGLTMAAYGASKMMAAKGGQVKHKPSGLSALAISKIG